MDPMLERQLREQVQQDLRPNEQIRWIGKPNPLQVAMPYMMFLIFGIFWFAVLIFFAAISIRAGGGAFGQLFLIPFVLAGLWIISSPVRAYLSGAKTIYAITNERAVIVRLGTSRRVESYGKSDVSRIETVERPDGSGDLMFAQQAYGGRNGYTQTRRVGLLGIANVKQVEAIMRTSLEEQNGPDGGSATAVINAKII